MHRLGLLVALLAAALPARAVVQEQVIELTATVADYTGRAVTHPFKVTVFRDDAIARAPFLVLNHGRPARPDDFKKMGRQRYGDNSKYFVQKGFVVFVPTRIGYGPTAGEDVEYSGAVCNARDYPPAYAAAAQQTLVILEHLRTLEYVDAQRGLLVGQSFGGATTIALAAKNPPGVVAAVNFAGGGGGDPVKRPGDPCRPDLLRQLFAGYGKSARIPTLWLYSENDKYFGKEHPHEWFKAFVAAGGRGEFVQLPAHGEDGHGSFTRNPGAWKPVFEDFLRRNGF
jgi:dienelactone hydrolase